MMVRSTAFGFFAVLIASTAFAEGAPDGGVPASVPAADGGVAVPAKARKVKRKVAQPREGKLPRKRDSFGDQQFRTALAEADALRTSQEWGKCYGKFLSLASERPHDPDVLWGLGQCGAGTALLVTDPAQVRTRLLDAKGYYERYLEAEERPVHTKGPTCRAAAARRVMGEIGAAVGKLDTAAPTAVAAAPDGGTSDGGTAPVGIRAAVVAVGPPVSSSDAGTIPALVAISPPIPGSGAGVAEEYVEAQRLADSGNFRGALDALAPLLKAQPEHPSFVEAKLVWKAQLRECDGTLEAYALVLMSKRPEVHAAAAMCAERLGADRARLEAYARYAYLAPLIDPSVFFELGETFRGLGDITRARKHYEHYLEVDHRPGFARQQRDARDRIALLATRRIMTPEEHVRCLAARGAGTSELVEVDGRWVVRTVVPNPRAPCTPP